MHKKAPPPGQPDDTGPASEEGIGAGALETEEGVVGGNAQEREGTGPEEEEGESEEVPTSQHQREKVEQNSEEELVDTIEGGQDTRPHSTPSQPSDGDTGSHREEHSESHQHQTRRGGEEYTSKASQEGGDEKVMESDWKREGAGGVETREEKEGKGGGEGGGEEGQKVESGGEDPVLDVGDSGVPGEKAEKKEKGSGKMNEEEPKEEEPEEGREHQKCGRVKGHLVIVTCAMEQY